MRWLMCVTDGDGDSDTIECDTTTVTVTRVRVTAQTMLLEKCQVWMCHSCSVKQFHITHHNPTFECDIFFLIYFLLLTAQCSIQ